MWHFKFSWMLKAKHFTGFLFSKSRSTHLEGIDRRIEPHSLLLDPLIKISQKGDGVHIRRGQIEGFFDVLSFDFYVEVTYASYASMESPQIGDLIKILSLMLKLMLMLMLMVTLRVLFLFKQLVCWWLRELGRSYMCCCSWCWRWCWGWECFFFQTHGCAQKSRRRPLFRAGGLSPSSWKER